jgi:hypothetical protein
VACRWCRTYFLKRGRTVPYLHDTQDVVADEQQRSQMRSESKSEARPAPSTSSAGAFDVVNVNPGLQRLEDIYTALWLALRTLVRTAFAANTDVLEAGTQVQAWLDDVMRGNHSPLQDGQQQTTQQEGCWGALPTLLSSERLQLHMDCMNALGQVISIEDVDDLGGSVSLAQQQNIVKYAFI